MTMRRIILYIMLLGATLCPSCGMAQRMARITVENHTGGDVYLQPEDTTGYHKMEGFRSVREIALDAPAYYRFVDKDYGFHPLFVTPGSRINIVCDADGVHVTGSHEAENLFMKEHAFLCRAPEGVTPYSREWLDYNDVRLQELRAELDCSGLPEDFIAVHKLYWEFAYIYQRLNEVQTARAFRNGSQAGPVVLADGYYDFLKTVAFDDERILWLPGWFRTMDKVFEEKEKQGFLPVSNAHYMTHYAGGIGNDKVRSRFLVCLAAQMLKKGYLDDFAAQWKEVCPLITDAEAQSALPGLEQAYADLRERDKHVACGMKMPSFEAHTVDGKTYKLEDFEGSLLVIDFWFTGCVPCKAEMPYLDKLAEELCGKGVRFISVSLDTGEQLMETWKKMVEGKGSSAVLNLNLPGGFKSDFMKTLGIRSVPRMLLVDREGRIVDAYAKRPSDPKLKQQIEQLLAE